MLFDIRITLDLNYFEEIKVPDHKMNAVDPSRGVNWAENPLFISLYTSSSSPNMTKIP
jgi:hypothetical protein